MRISRAIRAFRTGKGVEFVDFEQWLDLPFRAETGKQRCRALRMEALALDLEEMLQVVLYWTGQSYNFRFLDAMARSGRAYCSQLAVQILHRAGCPLEGVSIGEPITPTALFKKSVQSGAVEVTDRYAEYAQLLAGSSREFWRLKTDPVRAAVKRAAKQSLAVRSMEFEANAIATQVTKETIEILLNTPLPALTPGLPAGQEFADECSGAEFVLSQIERAISEYFVEIAGIPQHWTQAILSTSDAVRANGVMIFIAHLQRLTAMAQRLRDLREWMLRALMLLPSLRDEHSAAALALVQGMANHLEAYPVVADLPVGTRIIDMPEPVSALAGRPEVQALMREFSSLRAAWMELARNDARLREELAAARGAFTELPSAPD